MLQSYKLYTALFTLLFLGTVAQGQTAKSYGVLLQREGTTLPIKLNWNYDATTTSYKIYRKAPASNSWGNAIATLTKNDTTYTDNVTTGTWEYYVQRNLINSKLGHGYLLTSTTVANWVETGRMLLLIDANYNQPLQTEIAQLIQDFVADGYTVDTMIIARNTAVTDVKMRILNWYVAYRNHAVKPQNLYLLGRIPVPYSGVIFPDGHTPDHKGAWPADLYYGVLGEEMFTDTWANIDSATGTRNDNIPNDGKFDVDMIYPDSVVLQIGRVDLSNMPTFGLNDTLLVKQYLTKAHTFKTKGFTPNRKAIIDDNFGSMSGEAFAASGWRSFSSMIGGDNITEGDYLTNVKQQNHLLSFGCGGGTYTSANGIGNTANFNNDSINTVFTMLFGSYFGDWDNTNNFLRAPLCAKNPALASVWSGRPHWNLHHMSLGYPIGFSTRVTQNNVDGRLFSPATVSGYVSSSFPSSVHIALMGDPTLRLFYHAMPTQVSASANVDSTTFTISWVEPASALAYYVYVSNNPLTPGNLVGITTDTVLITSNVFPGNNYVTVRAKYQEVSASGSYYQLSLGSATTFVGGKNAVGLNELSMTNMQVKIYPNPSTQWFMLSEITATAQIEVYDLTGKVVFSKMDLNPTEPIYHTLNTGLYVVKVTSQGKIGYTKLLVN